MSEQVKKTYYFLHKVLETYDNSYPEYLSNTEVFKRSDYVYFNPNNKKKYNQRIEHYENIKVSMQEAVNYLLSKGLIANKSDEIKKITIEGRIYLHKGGFKKQHEIDDNNLEEQLRNSKLEIRKNYFVILASIGGWIFFAIEYFSHH